VEYWDYVGSGNMHSTVNDLLTWMSNFSNPQKGWEEHFKKIQTIDNFNNGEKNNYAFGVNIGDFNGIQSIGHGGSIGGFRSNVITYPEKELSIVILTNFSAASPGQKSNLISEIFIGKAAKEESKKDIKTITLSKKNLAKYEGSYWNDKGMYVRKIYVRDDTLRYFRSENNESPIVPLETDEFQMLGVSDKIIIKFEIVENRNSMITTANDGPPVIFQGFDPMDMNEAPLALYAGNYYSPELETTYRISVKEDTLYYHHSRHGDFPMKIVKKDILEGEWPFNIVRFQRDSESKIKGILVTNGRVRNLWFEKQD
jgi:hypothetical protein